jgi:uncharacterized protein (TIGR00255 family)
MTGYGKASVVCGTKKITAEIKSLNSKALDLSARIASAYREKEMELRSMVSERVLRGKVELSLWIEKDEVEQAAKLNAPLIKNYIEQFQEANAQYGIPMPENLMGVVMRMPDVLTRQEMQEELTDEEWQVVRQVVVDAVEQLMAFRAQEGCALEMKFKEMSLNTDILDCMVNINKHMRIEWPKTSAQVTTGKWMDNQEYMIHGIRHNIEDSIQLYNLIKETNND